MPKKKSETTEFKEEHHPNWYHDIPLMNVLILGSFPPHENKRDFPFYYPNKQNNFWKILSAISKTPLQFTSGQGAVDERKLIMEKLKAGVENMGRIIERKGTSAKDTDIRITKFHDISSILRKHKELSRIILAGFSAKDSTYQSFLKYLSLKGLQVILPDTVTPGTIFHFVFEKRTIECVICNSTSTATRIALSALTEQYAKFIPH